MQDINYPNDEAMRLHKCIETIWSVLIPDQEIDLFGEMLQLSLGVTRNVIYQDTIDSQGTAILEYIARIEKLEDHLQKFNVNWWGSRLEELQEVIDNQRDEIDRRIEESLTAPDGWTLISTESYEADLDEKQNIISDLENDIESLQNSPLGQSLDDANAEINEKRKEIDMLRTVNAKLRINPLHQKIDALETMYANQAQTIESQYIQLAEMDAKLVVANQEVIRLDGLLESQTEPEETPDAPE